VISVVQLFEFGKRRMDLAPWADVTCGISAIFKEDGR
jgi:hypothetical protein